MKRFCIIVIGVIVLFLLIAACKPERETEMMRIDREIAALALKYKMQAREKYICTDHAITLP